MGTLLRFPAIPPIRRDPQSRNLSRTIPDFVQQLKVSQQLADESLRKLADVPLSVVIDRLVMTLAGIDTIGRLLPAGKFKAQFDRERSALVTQIDLAKGKIIDLWEQPDLDGPAPL